MEGSDKSLGYETLQKQLTLLKHKGLLVGLKCFNLSSILTLFVFYFLSLQYFDDTYPTTKEQREFEKNLFSKTHRANGEWSIPMHVHEL